MSKKLAIILGILGGLIVGSLMLLYSRTSIACEPECREEYATRQVHCQQERAEKCWGCSPWWSCGNKCSYCDNKDKYWLFNDGGGWQEGRCPVPVDCVWSEWSECEGICGEGTQTRYHSVEAENGGKECEGDSVQACKLEPCELEGVCPTECDYEGGEAPDGQGGYKLCEATETCPEPEPEPEPMPEPVYESSREESRYVASGPIGCRDDLEGVTVNLNLTVETGTPNDNCMELSWNPAGWGLVHIQYKDNDGTFQADLVMEDDGHETICGLTNGVHHWFRAQAMLDCGRGGEWSEWIDPLP